MIKAEGNKLNDLGSPIETDEESHRASLRDLAGLSLRLGFTAFGGPAAHIAMLRQEVVVRRKWETEQQFLDMLGVTNLIPGPNSTEMVMHTGLRHQGWKGLLVAGWLFILPAASIVLFLAWLYMEYGTTPEAEWLLYGIKPVILAVIAQAVWGLARQALRSYLSITAGVVVLVLYLLGISELLLLIGAGIFLMMLKNRERWMPGASSVFLLGPIAFIREPGIATTGGASAEPYSLLRLFLTFIKIGSVLYGSGYVLISFLRNDFVERYGWLTEQQLLDAVAIGQFTPGPVFTTATFVGYVAGGFPGAVLATLGIFLPAFVFVAAIQPLVPRLRKSKWMSGFLDGVNIAAIGLMAAVAVELAPEAAGDWLTAGIAMIATFLAIRVNVNSTWLLAGGTAIGLLLWLTGFDSRV